MHILWVWVKLFNETESNFFGQMYSATGRLKMLSVQNVPRVSSDRNPIPPFSYSVCSVFPFQLSKCVNRFLKMIILNSTFLFVCLFVVERKKNTETEETF